MGRESWVMLIHYITAIILVVALTAHLLLHSPFAGLDFESSLSFINVAGNLKNLGPLFFVLLLAAVIHGVNGLRILLLELWQNKGWNLFVNIIAIVLIVALIAIGTMTLIGVQA